MEEIQQKKMNLKSLIYNFIIDYGSLAKEFGVPHKQYAAELAKYVIGFYLAGAQKELQAHSVKVSDLLLGFSVVNISVSDTFVMDIYTHAHIVPEEEFQLQAYDLFISYMEQIQATELGEAITSDF